MFYIPRTILLLPLYFLISSLFLSNPYSLPSGNHQNVLCVYKSISVLFVHLFFRSVVNRHVFIATLLFIFFIYSPSFLSSSPFPLPSSSRKLFNISYNTGLVAMNPFSFFLFGKLFICPSILNGSFSG